jgi:hypothetical protein
VLCALAGGVAGWFGHSAWIDRQTIDDRAMASGELPSQRTSPLEPLPVPEPEAAPAPAEILPQMGEAFVERFDGGVDERWSVSDGWSNGGWMTNDWRRSSVEIVPGLMAILLQPGPEGSKYKLSSGELQSHDRHRYGYFEVRMKVPRGAGLVTGFFSYAGQDGRTRPNEIDIEILGRNTRVAELTIHENGEATSTKVTLPFDAADGFHVYGFDWQPGHVRWYIDGQLVHAETGGAAPGAPWRASFKGSVSNMSRLDPLGALGTNIDSLKYQFLPRAPRWPPQATAWIRKSSNRRIEGRGGGKGRG